MALLTQSCSDFESENRRPRYTIRRWCLETFFQRDHCQRGCATSSTKLGQFQSEMRLQSRPVFQEFRAVYLTASPEAMLLQGEVPELMLADIWLACVIGDAPHAPRRA